MDDVLFVFFVSSLSMSFQSFTLRQWFPDGVT